MTNFRHQRFRASLDVQRCLGFTFVLKAPLLRLCLFHSYPQIVSRRVTDCQERFLQHKLVLMLIVVWPLLLLRV